MQAATEASRPKLPTSATKSARKGHAIAMKSMAATKGFRIFSPRPQKVAERDKQL
jgi:hypothetical protein